MPEWFSKSDKLVEQIAELDAKIELQREKSWARMPEIIEELAPMADLSVFPSVSPAIVEPLALPRKPQLPTIPVTAKPPSAPIEVPLWQRALQVFATPFEWVDENVIKPTLALGATTGGFIKEVKRKPGEDFWEWKKRSWQKWKAPGVDVNVPWSDDPLRLDLRGVLEFAPWLLLPGAGQVGTGARAARGVAGLLGKAGQAGRILGRAVEYSPWGLVEKTAGVAIKGAARAVGHVSERVSTSVGEKLFGKYTPPPLTAGEQKLLTFFKESVIPARKKFEKALPGLRSRQEAMAQNAFARARKGEITFAEAEVQAKKLLGKVEGIRAQFAAKAKDITKEETEEFLKKIDSAAESGLVDMNLTASMKNSLMGLDLPMPAELKAFGRIFGRDFAKAVSEISGAGMSSWEKVIDALNLPRAVLASADLSATFRQGLILGLIHPTKVPRWFGKQIKAFLSEKMALDMDDALRANPLYNQAVKDGVYFAPLKEAAASAAEELFMSKAARTLPLVRRSERAFITYLNEARMSTYKAAHSAMTAQGAKPGDFKLISEFINKASGRGNLPKGLEKYSPAFNTVLFSPRLQAATLQLPRQIGRMLLSKNPYMRKEAAKALIGFVGGGSTLIGLLNMSGNKVELDPRSGDFGKIIIGKTRLDIWRGYVQYARFTAQMLTGERKSAYGNMSKAERGEIAARFLQSKSSPAFGLMVDLLRGENYFGRPIFNDTTGFIDTVKERILPLALQDVIDAMEQSGTNGLWVAAPAILGIGALTLVNELVKVKEKIAKDAGYDSWDDIDPKTQREIQNRNIELQAAYIDFDRQVMGTAWGDWRSAGNSIEDVFKENVGLAVSQFRTTQDGYQFRQKISDAFTARRGGYDARNKELRFEEIVRRMDVEDTAESLLKLGPEQMAIKIYNDALFGEDMYDEFGDYRFDEADIRKEQLRQQLGEELFTYVEDYRGLKFENLPPEFQQLTEAKRVLRPYWQVKDEMTRIRGEPKTLWQERRLEQLIQRVKKKMLSRSRSGVTDPALARYYEMFYVKP